MEMITMNMPVETFDKIVAQLQVRMSTSEIEELMDTVQVYWRGVPEE